MAKNRRKWVIPVIALVFGMVAVGVYAAASVWELTTKDAVTPDENSVVIYFVGGKGLGSVWDGDTPIGNFNEKKVPGKAIIPYKTTPGQHYFLFNATNWTDIVAELEPNKQYVVVINWIPAPFATIVVPSAGKASDLNDKKAKYVKFSDDWRAGFAKGKTLSEAQVKFQEVKNDGSEVSLSGANGF
jgi:hypothetical protein